MSTHHPLIRRLAAAHYAKDSDMSHIRRWKFDHPTGPVTRLAGGATHTEFQAAALTAQSFAIWHTSRREVHYGKTGTNLGRAMRQLGHPGAYGPNDPGARRLADNLLAAATADQLARTLVTIMDRLRNTDHPPNWEQLHTDLADWLNPATRNQVRLAWGQGFATPAATPQEAVTTD